MINQKTNDKKNELSANQQINKINTDIYATVFNIKKEQSEPRVSEINAVNVEMDHAIKNEIKEASEDAEFNSWLATVSKETAWQAGISRGFQGGVKFSMQIRIKFIRAANFVQAQGWWLL